MKLAMRGVVDAGGDVVVWPTLLADHEQVFCVLPHLRQYRARFRQWEPEGFIDFDPGANPGDAAKARRVLEAMGCYKP